MSRIEKLENLLAVKMAVRNIVEKEGQESVSEERLDEFMKSIGNSYLK